MVSYQNPPNSDEDEETAVPLVITNLPPTTTTHRSRMMMAFVAMMLLMVAGGAAWMMQDGSSYTAVAESLVVTTVGVSGSCLPATDTFSGVSTTDDDGSDYAFETCFQLKQLETYCWTKSYYLYIHDDGMFFPCEPIGDKWHAISAEDVNPVTHPNSCGLPCQDQTYDAPF